MSKPVPSRIRLTTEVYRLKASRQLGIPLSEVSDEAMLVSKKETMDYLFGVYEADIIPFAPAKKARSDEQILKTLSYFFYVEDIKRQLKTRRMENSAAFESWLPDYKAQVPAFQAVDYYCTADY